MVAAWYFSLACGRKTSLIFFLSTKLEGPPPVTDITLVSCETSWVAVFLSFCSPSGDTSQSQNCFRILVAWPVFSMFPFSEVFVVARLDISVWLCSAGDELDSSPSSFQLGPWEFKKEHSLPELFVSSLSSETFEITFARERILSYLGSSLFNLCFLWRCWGSLSVTTMHWEKGLGFLEFFPRSSLFHLWFPAEAASWLANSYFLRSLNLVTAALEDSVVHLLTLRWCFGRWTTFASQCGTGHVFLIPFPSFLVSLFSSFSFSLSSCCQCSPLLHFLSSLYLHPSFHCPLHSFLHCQCHFLWTIFILAITRFSVSAIFLSCPFLFIAIACFSISDFSLYYITLFRIV